MSDANEGERILNAEAEKQLIKARDETLAEVLKLQLVVQELKRMRVEDLNFNDERGQIKHALKILKAGEYLHLKATDNEYLLNLHNCRSSVDLSYTEMKAVREHLVEKLRANLKPIAALGQKMRKECPELFANVSSTIGASTSAASTSTVARILHSNRNAQPISIQLLNLETERRKKLQELAAIQSKKCELLKAAFELKSGPHLVNELKLLHSQARLSQAKASLLNDFMTNEIITCTDHSLKAVKEVEGYIDLELERLDK